MHTLNVMKISFFPTGIRTVCPSSTPANRKKEGMLPCIIIHMLLECLQLLPSPSACHHSSTTHPAARGTRPTSGQHSNTLHRRPGAVAKGRGCQHTFTPDVITTPQAGSLLQSLQNSFGKCIRLRNTGQPPQAAGKLQAAHPGRSQSSNSSAPLLILLSLVRKAISTLLWEKLRLSRFPPSPQASSKTNRSPKATKHLRASLFKSCLQGSMQEPKPQLRKGKANISIHVQKVHLLTSPFSCQAISLLCSYNFSAAKLLTLLWHWYLAGAWRKVPCCWPSGSKSLWLFNRAAHKYSTNQLVQEPSLSSFVWFVLFLDIPRMELLWWYHDRRIVGR